jgi:hypothetical protein
MKTFLVCGHVQHGDRFVMASSSIDPNAVSIDVGNPDSAANKLGIVVDLEMDPAELVGIAASMIRCAQMLIAEAKSRNGKAAQKAISEIEPKPGDSGLGGSVDVTG